MKVSYARIPLVIALSSALALAAGCENRTADDRAAQTTTPAVAAPADPMTQADGTYADGTPASGDARPGMVGDGRDSDQPVDDTWITTKVKSSLLADTDVAGLAIDVETLNGVVTLTGQVDQQSQIEEATRIAREIEGVTDVQASGLVARAN